MPTPDVAQHVQRVALPLPGDETELFRAIACALERPLDPNRPPWECWIIEGVKDNQWAILLKVHHSMADDNSAAHLLTRLCDDAEVDAFTSQVADNRISPLVHRRADLGRQPVASSGEHVQSCRAGRQQRR